MLLIMSFIDSIKHMLNLKRLKHIEIHKQGVKINKNCYDLHIFTSNNFEKKFNLWKMIQEN